MSKEEILLAQSEHLFPSVFHYYQQPLVISHAKNQYIWDADGKQYLDFFGGIVTVSVGHCNDDVNRKVHAQIDRLQHVSTVFANEPQAALAKRIAGITPLGRIAEADHIAKTVLFLASDDSAHVQSVEIFVDGGATGSPAGAPVFRG